MQGLDFYQEKLSAGEEFKFVFFYNKRNSLNRKGLSSRHCEATKPYKEEVLSCPHQIISK
jgi:hypothetical protein